MGSKRTRIQTVVRDSTPAFVPEVELPSEPATAQRLGGANQVSTVSVPVANPKLSELERSAPELIEDLPKDLLREGRFFYRQKTERLAYVRRDETVVELQTHSDSLDRFTAAPEPAKATILAGLGSTWGSLPAAPDGQALIGDSAAQTGYSWASFQPSAVPLTEIAGITPVKGRMLVGNGTSWLPIDPGTDGFALIADSGQATGLNWGERDPGLTTQFGEDEFVVQQAVIPANTLSFNLSALTTARTISIPNANGTVALTSDLSSYLRGVSLRYPLYEVRKFDQVVEIGIKAGAAGGLEAGTGELQIRLAKDIPLRTDTRGLRFRWNAEDFELGSDQRLQLRPITGAHIAAGTITPELLTSSVRLLPVSTASQVLVTTAGNVADFVDQRTAFNKNFGSTAGTVCQGNDVRLHSQNTDVGTSSQSFELGLGGDAVLLRALLPDVLDVRESGDGDWGSLRSGELTVNGNATITGNLEVQGTQVIIDTVTMEVEDAIILTNRDAADSGDNESGGIEVKRYDSGDTLRSIFFGWDESLNRVAVDTPNVGDTTTSRHPVARVFSEIIGDEATKSFELVHNLHTEEVVVQVWDQTTSPKEEVKADVRVTDPTTVQVDFTSTPGLNQYRVVVIG